MKQAQFDAEMFTALKPVRSFKQQWRRNEHSTFTGRGVYLVELWGQRVTCWTFYYLLFVLLSLFLFYIC